MIDLVFDLFRTVAMTTCTRGYHGNRHQLQTAPSSWARYRSTRTRWPTCSKNKRTWVQTLLSLRSLFEWIELWEFVPDEPEESRGETQFRHEQIRQLTALHRLTLKNNQYIRNTMWKPSQPALITRELKKPLKAFVKLCDMS